MKIRNGFVSNSSSSSFVVALKEKPKSSDDILTVLFGQDYGMKFYDYEANTSDIAYRLFEDIKKITQEKLEDLMRDDYYCSKDYCLHEHHYEGKSNEENYKWNKSQSRYFCSDNDLAASYIELEKHLNELEKSFYEKRRKFLKEHNVDEEELLKNTSKTDKEHKEYIIFYNKFNKERKKIWEKQSEIRKEMAKKDAKNFLDDHKGEFIFTVKYSDNDGPLASIMEHGEIFERVPHLTFSYH